MTAVGQDTKTIALRLAHEVFSKGDLDAFEALFAEDWLRVADGRIVEHWTNFDQVGFLQQLGALRPTLPMPGCLGFELLEMRPLS